MGLKQYEIITPKQANITEKSLESTLQNAILLAVLEQKYMTLWQYEMCCDKLKISNTIKHERMDRGHPF